jgi:hypothetical protein
MATNTQKKRAIKYLNRDFESFKRDLTEHLKVYFPDTIQDFNESSVGMMFTELVSFIGDNLSYYLDKKFDESFIESSRERSNVFKHAKQLGFKTFGKSSAIGTVDAYLQVPASASAGKILPDARYLGTIKKGAKLKGDNGETYETLVDVDFSKVDTSISENYQVNDQDATTEEPLNFIVKSEGVDIKAGETKTATFTVTTYEAFKKITIAEDDVLEILDVTDSEGNKWYEVDFLAQDTVFEGVANTGADATAVPYVLKLRSVPYRFITEFDIDTNRLSLIFGTGDAQNFDGELIPDLGDLALPLHGKDAFTDFSIDPQNFLKTRTMGLAPVNTTLTVKYRAGGGANTNAGANTITTVVESAFDVGDSTLPTATVRDVANSLAVANTNPVQGGKDELPLAEIKQLISANFSAQARAVTAPDFVVRSLSMPSKFGSVFRANARVNPLNKSAVELVVLSRDVQGKASTAPGDLKVNLKRYLSRFRMLTDAVEILDGEIINVALEFEVLTNPDFNKSEVIVNCIESLKEFFEIDKWQINQPINKTSINCLLAQIPGVLSVISMNFVNRVGNYDSRSYSTTIHNVAENTQNGIIYGKENAIFEVKFPNRDIIGVAR